MFYHNTIRRYTLALLNFFSKLEIQYTNSKNNLITKNIPIHYKFQEKEIVLDKSEEQIITGNTNVLPRAVLELTGLTQNTNRQASKFLKINRVKDNDNEARYQWNCISYDFNYTLTILCRGMNEVSQIIEEIAPKFNPLVYLDVYDAEDESEATRVPLAMNDISFGTDGFDEKSMNIFTVTFNFTLSGYLFEPINAYSIIKEYKINLNTPRDETEILDFDVKNSLPVYPPKYTKYNDNVEEIQIRIIDLVKNSDTLELIYETNVAVENLSIDFTSENCEIYDIQKEQATCKVKNIQNFANVTCTVSYRDVSESITIEI